MKKSELKEIIREELNEFNENKYPELDKLAIKLVKELKSKINKESAKIKGKMTYKAFYVLEKIIQILDV